MPDRTLAEASSAKEDYTGHERDAETSLHYAGARYYMSALGRWTAVDPLADEFPAWSGYHYSYNNPLGFIDPDGMASCDITLCGENGSSVTIETDLVDVEVDVSSLPGTDFGGNHTIGGRDAVLAGLDLAGTVDPTPISDGLAASMYVEDGDYGNAALSALGFIPAFGDVGKLARVGKHIDAVRSAIQSGGRGKELETIYRVYGGDSGPAGFSLDPCESRQSLKFPRCCWTAIWRGERGEQHWKICDRRAGPTI